jgi:membrane protease YdiL (CAAX protease family)
MKDTSEKPRKEFPQNNAVSISSELKSLWLAIKTLEFGPTFIIISVMIIQILCNYYTSRKFFRANISQLFSGDRFLPLYEYIYWFSGDFLLQFVLTLLLIRIILKGKLREYGVGLGDIKIGLRIAVGFIALMIPVVWIVSGFESFQRTYPECSLVKDSWSIFFIYEAFVLLYMTGWEFIWRGYVLFGLKRQFGYYAVLIQTIPFVLMHLGKPQLETFGSVIAGIALGILALRTRSFWYCVLAHTSVMFTIDLISVLRYKTQIYGTSPGALLDLIRKIS